MGFSGTWFNELGSKMTLNGSGGALSGTYQTAVGDASGVYALSGRYDTAPKPSGQAMSWSVAWQNAYRNSNSATGWTGQYHPAVDGMQEEIYTLWLLASELPASQNWTSVRVGQDTFTRKMPSQQTVLHRMRAAGPPHPPELLDAEALKKVGSDE